MTDQEVICTWMEPKPAKRPEYIEQMSEEQWWFASPANSGGWDCELDLDALWEVEERLTDEQCRILNELLEDELVGSAGERASGYKWHFTAEQKITALAQVIRR